MAEKRLKKFLTGFKRKIKPAVKKEEVKKEKVEKAKEIEKDEKIEDKKQQKSKTEIKKTVKKLIQRQGVDISILLRPIITEKATDQEVKGCYIFEVNSKANKISIKKAIEQIYGVKPLRVNIIRVRGKKVRYGRSTGKTKAWKKALVFLKKGDKLQFVQKS
ncbi:50S ribosomal protein L23 [Patescibacteria group bacterium]|nr:50S ribosomal protein L23 [Patescibacteria group bacterium]